MGETSTPPGGVGRVLSVGLDKAISINQSVVAAHVRRIRERHPEASPRDVIALLEKQYLAAVISTGAAAGGVAAAPAVGTAASLAVSAGEMVSFLQASALFSLAVAEVHGLRIDDLERRRTLLLAVLLGDTGASFVEKTAARTGKHWGKLLTDAIPMSTITGVNKVLGRWFITKYGTKQGIIVIGRLAPFGIGAGIGGVGNALFGRTVIAGARRAFGPPGVWNDTSNEGAEGASEPPPNQEAAGESSRDTAHETTGEPDDQPAAHNAPPWTSASAPGQEPTRPSIVPDETASTGEVS